MMPRMFRYDMLTSSLASEPQGVNRQAYLSMGELKPMRGYSYRDAGHSEKRVCQLGCFMQRIYAETSSRLA
eukprot:6429498-Karenia_brevis.AAC.1